MSKVILEALWAMLIDASCVDDTIVYLGTEGHYLVVGHHAVGTPLSDPNITLEQIDLAMSTMDFLLKAAMMLPWSKWIGLPLVNAYAEEMQLTSVGERMSLIVKYRQGGRVSVDESSPLPSTEARGVELRFCADRSLIGSIDRPSELVDRICERMLTKDRAKVRRL